MRSRISPAASEISTEPGFEDDLGIILHGVDGRDAFLRRRQRRDGVERLVIGDNVELEIRARPQFLAQLPGQLGAQGLVPGAAPDAERVGLQRHLPLVQCRERAQTRHRAHRPALPAGPATERVARSVRVAAEERHGEGLHRFTDRTRREAVRATARPSSASSVAKNRAGPTPRHPSFSGRTPLKREDLGQVGVKLSDHAVEFVLFRYRARRST
jgi:hypothetical protein